MCLCGCSGTQNKTEHMQTQYHGAQGPSWAWELGKEEAANGMLALLLLASNALMAGGRNCSGDHVKFHFASFREACPPGSTAVMTAAECRVAARAMERRFTPVAGRLTRDGDERHGACFAWNGAKPLTRISLQNRNVYFGSVQKEKRQVSVCRGCRDVTRVFLRGSAKAGTTFGEYMARNFWALSCQVHVCAHHCAGAASRRMGCCQRPTQQLVLMST